MPNIIDILARALSLRQETALNSITPNRAGGIMYDTLLVLNQMQLEGGALLISKVYASVSAMEADTTPTSDLTGRALKPGQLVVIVTSDSSSSDMGSEYRFNGPGSWTYVGKVGGLPLDTVPTQSSTKGITSGGVYTALAAMKAEGYKYMGLATPGAGGTAPGTPNQPVFYIAGPGSYPNFGSITVASGYLGFIKYSGGSWSVESVAVGKDYDAQISALNGQITQLEAKVSEVEAVLSESPVDIIDANNPQYTGKYWSAGGVLSTSANWRADTVNLINYRGKTITFCLGIINGDGLVVSSYNWIKKSDNSFVSLSDIMTQLPRTKNAMFIVPDDAVELQVSWDAVKLSSNNCVAYAQADKGQNFYGHVDAISKTIGFTKSTPTYTLESGYWDIRNTPPSINTGVASVHTSPIALSKGDWLHFVISNGAGITAVMGAIVLVDSSGNSIASIIGGDGSKTDFSWRATQDCYISISYATGFTLIKSIEIYNSSVIEEIFNEISGANVSPYSGKIWHCFGTSISNTSVEGKYPVYLEQMSGMQRVNFGRSGGCIGPSNSGGNYILNAIKNDTNIAQADVVTIEGFVNDWSQNVPIGELTDTDGATSFMGALYEALTYIQSHSNAQIFVITDNTGRLYNGIDIRRTNVRASGKTQNDYIEATIRMCNYMGIPVIDAGRKSMISQDTATLYLADQIHHTELGGYQFARVIWDEMKRFSPRALSLPE